MRATDNSGQYVEGTFAVTVGNVDEAPRIYDVNPAPDSTLESLGNNAATGLTILIEDPEYGPVNYTILDDSDGQLVRDPGTGVVTVLDPVCPSLLSMTISAKILRLYY